ncbi:Endopolyphosphatase [Tulasnella sp. 419]|nr:Endopolyphosphatase [Tulasnella sp. 419]
MIPKAIVALSAISLLANPVRGSPIALQHQPQIPLVADKKGLSSDAVIQDTRPSSGKHNVVALDSSKKKLHGRFIHISDIHPDPWYVTKGRLSTQCHRKKPKREKEKGGYWGTAQSEDCDSPMPLVNLVMEWLEKEWADKVDFVIWTGDSARHDNDHLLPRSPDEIYELNRQTVARMDAIFVPRGVPVVPTMGNNDLYPHNIMFHGPNKVTNEYLSIWKNHIPFPSYQVFHRGAYFSREIIPNHLAAISLNTIYFYDSNKAVDGCPPHTEDPGTLQLDWLEVQLDMFRSRKMQVWIMGHVPPTMGNYYQDCYLAYAKLALRFQDTIVGHLFGHMNVDYFFWIDAHELHHPPNNRTDPPSGHLPRNSDNELVSAKGKPRYSLAETLLHDFRSLPPAKKPPKGSEQDRIHLDDYAIVNVGPSVVPAFQPSIRVFTYNVTQFGELPEPGDGDDDGDDDDDDGDDDDDDEDLIDEFSPNEVFTDEEWYAHYDEELTAPPPPDGGKKKKGSKRHHGHDHRRPPGKIDCTRRKNRDKDECVFKKPRYASKFSPSRMNTLWSPLGYTQFYLPDLDTSNVTSPPTFEVEYMTYPVDQLAGEEDWPVPRHLLPPSIRNLTKSSLAKRVRSDDDPDDEFTPYEMNDLTIPSWIKLARKMGQKKKLFGKFKSFMYMGGEEP